MVSSKLAHRKFSFQKTVGFFIACFLIGLSGCALLPQQLPVTPVELSGTWTSQDQAKLNFIAAQMAEINGKFEDAARYYRLALEQDPDSLMLRRHLINSLVQLQHFQEAIREYDLLAKQSPEDAKNDYVLGQLNEAAGNTRDAEAQYRQAVSKGQDKSEAMTQLGILCLKEDKREEGRGWLERALKTDPLDREAREALVKYHLQKGETAPAEKLLRDGTILMPEEIEWQADLGSVLAESPGREAEALEIYRQLVRLHPDYPEARRYLANYYMKAKKWAEVAEQLEQILKLKPEDLAVTRNLALAYYEMGDWNRAREVLISLKEAGKADAFAHYLLGSIYQKKGLLFLAVDEFRTALQMDPELPEAYLGLAQMLMDTNELENASTLLEKARVKFPNATEFMVSQALVLLRLQKPGQAEELLKQALALKPDNGLILFHLGRAYQQENNFPEAIHYWKETVRVDPSMAEAYNYLAYLHAEQGSHLDQAKGWIDKALALDPDNGFYLDTAGWIDFQKKNYPQALRQTLKARDAMQAAHQPVDPVVYEHMGDIYFEMKNYPEAQRSWQLALASDPKNAGIQGKLSRLPSPEGKQKP